MALEVSGNLNQSLYAVGKLILLVRFVKLLSLLAPFGFRLCTLDFKMLEASETLF